ncbi:MAG: FtsW/RodA/SpoVE family cell cycle protein, partial [Acidobacteria bacterium]|nr:FtsW/RodA/SpoVE family cell cycle protein [Acidobacteriota bacterium]
MKEARFDRHILTLTLLLVSAGIVAIYSASFIFAMTRKGTPNFFLWRQMLFALIGFILLFIIMKIPLNFLSNKKFLTFVFCVQVFLLIFVFFFPKVNGAHRWIQIFGFSIQPSEFAKITAILLTAHFLSKKQDAKNEWNKLLQIGLPLSLIIVLILIEKDFGMSVLIISIV